MGWLTVGIFVLVVPGSWAYFRAQRELAERDRLTARTVAAAFVAYFGHALITALSALRGVGPLPLDPGLAGGFGLLMVAIGAGLYLAARTEFGSFRRTWGLDCETLITSGVYRYSRHPQTVGSILVLAGAGLAGRSGVALALAAALTLTSALWLPVEEQFLERRFGERYVHYRSRTACLFGVPRLR